MSVQDGRTGLLVSSRRQCELVRALRRLITAPELQMRIGREARRWAENKFSHIRDGRQDRTALRATDAKLNQYFLHRLTIYSQSHIKSGKSGLDMVQ